MNIGRVTALILLGTAAHVLCGIGYSQSAGSTPATTPDDSAKTHEGAKDYFSRTVKVTAEARVRIEATRGSNFTMTPADAYALTRIRLGVAFQPVRQLRFFAQAEDSRAEFYQAKPASTLIDPFDLRQAYVELGGYEGSKFDVRVGRQALFIGSSRLLSTGDWSNITKNFDVARGTISYGILKLDVIAGSAILDDPNRMDRNKPGEHFYVAYSALKKLIPGASIEPYFMTKTALDVKGKDGKLGNADTLYGGTRIIGIARGGFDYNAEAIREGGEYAHDTVQALGYVFGGGWKWADAKGKLHFSSDFAKASGDSGRNDGHHESFDYLYGSQQPLTSLTGQFAWRNIADWRAGVDFAPLKRLKVQIDYRDYWLATVKDGLYNCFGMRTVFDSKATSNHVGEGVDTQFNMTITPKTFLGVGIGTLSPGSYLVEAHKTSGYVYPYLSFTRTF